MGRAATAYRRASEAAASPRQTEIAAFGLINRRLMAAETESDRLHALGANHKLWSTLARDLAQDSNPLPQELKAQLLSIGEWSMRYSTLAMLQNLPFDPILEVNTNVLDGLRGHD